MKTMHASAAETQDASFQQEALFAPERPRVLCVDDEPMNLRLLESVLGAKGYDAVMARNGTEALSVVAAGKIDVVLLDVMMPGMDGYEVCKKIKGDEKLRNIPVIMITALKSKEDRIRSIEAGAEDFISKPFDRAEVLARVGMLLNVKSLNDRLGNAYTNIANLTFFGEKVIKTFDSRAFNFLSKIDGIVQQLLRHSGDAGEAPSLMLVGMVTADQWQWYRYDAGTFPINRSALALNVHRALDLTQAASRTTFSNKSELGASEFAPFIEMIRPAGVTVSNLVCYLSDELCMLALNYGRAVTSFDAAVLNSLVMQSLFLRSLSTEIREVEDAFAYTVHALARAAEANDEDTGNHILRVGEYCAVMAEQLGMSEGFMKTIRLHAMLHDVGKVHTNPDILKKPGKLTPEEMAEIRKHPFYSAQIIGDHPRFGMAKTLALSHHERWDGSGYPQGLRGDRIPLEGRIITIGDQYDALRNLRVYKPAYDHQTAYRIITEGDGRTLPDHFDPAVLRAFKEVASRFDELYEKLKG